MASFAAKWLVPRLDKFLAQVPDIDVFMDIQIRVAELSNRGHHVAILSDMAIRAENIDEAKAEEARRRAEARLAEKIEGEDAAMVQAALSQSLAQLKVKRRQR